MTPTDADTVRAPSARLLLLEARVAQAVRDGSWVAECEVPPAEAQRTVRVHLSLNGGQDYCAIDGVDASVNVFRCVFLRPLPFPTPFARMCPRAACVRGWLINAQVLPASPNDLDAALRSPGWHPRPAD